jgi:phosphoribosylformylglycinamidine synthase
MGFDTIKDVRVGKYMEIMLEEKEKDVAEQKIKEMCDKVLTNPVIEEYSYDILEVRK